jgi:hypothetical protein
MPGLSGKVAAALAVAVPPNGDAPLPAYPLEESLPPSTPRPQPALPSFPPAAWLGQGR